MNKRNIIIVIVLIIIVGLIAFAIWFFRPPQGGTTGTLNNYYQYDSSHKSCTLIYVKEEDYIAKPGIYKNKDDCEVSNNIKQIAL